MDKYKNRDSNHRKSRIDLAHRLVDEFVLPRLTGKRLDEITLLDVGCSIGTFAIEFAKRGLRTFGIDFSPSAIDLARKLSKEEGVNAEFICGDIVNLRNELPRADIVSCFDIFEHLHDDELGALLKSLKDIMPDKGYIIFHTYPTQYDYIFFGKRLLRWPMVLFRSMPPKHFNIVVKAYAGIIDAAKLLFKGGTQRELIRSEAHCNPTTRERLTEIFERAGWELVFIETSHLYEYDKSVQKTFSRQPIVHRDIQGVATKL